MIVDAPAEREAKIPLVIIKLMKVLRGATIDDLKAIGAEFITLPAAELTDRKRMIR
jgi:hypothetical protein